MNEIKKKLNTTNQYHTLISFFLPFQISTKKTSTIPTNMQSIYLKEEKMFPICFAIALRMFILMVIILLNVIKKTALRNQLYEQTSNYCSIVFNSIYSIIK